MRKINFIILFCILAIFLSCEGIAQNPVNWSNDQLLQAADLSRTLKANKDLPVIFSIGPGSIIPHSKEIGMVREAENLAKFKEQLSKLSKNTKIVVYCGCCPYEHCPNVRPAIQVLKDMKFTNYKLLDLPHNIKVDWIEKGYPTQNPPTP